MTTRAFDAVLCDVDGVIRFFDGAGVAALERAAVPGEGSTAAVGFAPERCLFVDDRQENVDAAVALGMTGVLYRGSEDLRRALAPVLN
ncbi:HAD-IA family hydrolase [Kitasatospora sp. NPDC058190]|uniref:HAD-IA family hydrolase n=1 Tax=Kitasatospora sp. NPDC058190 TaxID=3346371 RepID=UPI0036DE4CDF